MGKGYAVYGNYGGRHVSCTYGDNHLIYTEDACGAIIVKQGSAAPPDVAKQLEAWHAPDGLIDSMERELTKEAAA